MESNTASLEQILKGCRKNDRACQRLLYERYYGYAMSICLRYADNRDEASVILNDAFMKILSNIKQFDLGKPLKPWFRRILINTAINHYNAKQRQIQLAEMERADQEAETENIISGISYQEIIEILHKLPPSYRTVFNLYAIEGYKHEEIASLLGISVGTSKSNLFKAKEQLKKILNDFFQADYVAKK